MSLLNIKAKGTAIAQILRLSEVNLQISLYYLGRSIITVTVALLRIIMRLLPFSVLGQVLAAGYRTSLPEFVTVGLAFSAALNDSLISPLRSWRQKGIFENHMVSKLGVRGVLLSHLVLSCIRGEVLFATILIMGNLISPEFSLKTLPYLMLMVPSISMTGFGIMLMSAGYHLRTQRIVPVPLYLRFLTWAFGEVFFPLDKISPILSRLGWFVPTIFLIRRLRFVYSGTPILAEILSKIAQTYLLGVLFLVLGFLVINGGLEEARSKGTTTRIFLGV